MAFLGQRIQSQSLRLRQLKEYYDGTQPLAFVPADVAEQLQDRIAKVNTNYCKLLTDNLQQRITVQGFKLAGHDNTDPGLWQAWKSNNFVAESKYLIHDFLAYGRAYATVWATPGGVSIACEAPTEFAVYRDPVTRAILGGCKQWSVIDDLAGNEASYAVLYLPTEIITFASKSPAPVNGLPSTAWQIIERVANPLGLVPVVEFLNRTTVTDWHGTSEFECITSLQDGLNKVTLDSLITSEYYSYARRYITGFVVPDDPASDDGEPLEVFGKGKDQVWTAENTEAKFGQFEAQSLQGFDTLSNLLQNQISAVSGLPQYLCGVGTANPQSVDAINAAEQSLVAKASAKIDLLAPGFALLAALVLAVKDGRRAVDPTQIDTVFAPLTQQAPATQTDAFTKLTAAGVPMKIAAKKALGWSDSDAAELPNTPVRTGNNDERTNNAAAER